MTAADTSPGGAHTTTEPWLDVDVTVPLGSGALRLAFTAQGPRLALVGPSGAGKTTALRVLAGVERRASGRVTALGDVWQDSRNKLFTPPWLRRTGWVPQEAALFPHRSVRENLAWSFGSVDDTELGRVAALLEIEGLLERRPRHLSGGERQRVSLGRALLARPRLLLLDEPFSALDRPRRARLSAVVADECARQGLRLVLVSHDDADVSALASETYAITQTAR